MESATCFLYGMTYQPNALPNIIQKALTAHLSSAPCFPPGTSKRKAFYNELGTAVSRGVLFSWRRFASMQPTTEEKVTRCKTQG